MLNEIHRIKTNLFLQFFFLPIKIILSKHFRSSENIKKIECEEIEHHSSTYTKSWGNFSIQRYRIILRFQFCWKEKSQSALLTIWLMCCGEIYHNKVQLHASILEFLIKFRRKTNSQTRSVVRKLLEGFSLATNHHRVQLRILFIEIILILPFTLSFSQQ